MKYANFLMNNNNHYQIADDAQLLWRMHKLLLLKKIERKKEKNVVGIHVLAIKMTN